jgi:hypothetical protein
MMPTATKHKAQEVMLGLLDIQRFLIVITEMLNESIQKMMFRIKKSTPRPPENQGQFSI